MFLRFPELKVGRSVIWPGLQGIKTEVQMSLRCFAEFFSLIDNDGMRV